NGGRHNRSSTARERGPVSRQAAGVAASLPGNAVSLESSSLLNSTVSTRASQLARTMSSHTATEPQPRSRFLSSGRGTFVFALSSPLLARPARTGAPASGLVGVGRSRRAAAELLEKPAARAGLLPALAAEGEELQGAPSKAGQARPA